MIQENGTEMNLSLLLTGNELMAGEITDTNSVFMARELTEAGLAVNRKMVVGDSLSSLKEALTLLSRTSDIVIVNGGLGSTVDDLTAEVAAFVSGTELVENVQAIEHIEKRLDRKFLMEKSPFFNQIRKQALIPHSAELLENPVGLALGFRMKINRAICYFTPGVPRELKEMFQQSILPDICRLYNPNTSKKTAHLNIMGIGESQVQQMITQNITEEALQGIELGFRAELCCVELKVSINDSKNESALRDVVSSVKGFLAEYIFSETESLPESVIKLLRQQNKRVALAESCTGGLIASQITAVPGASDVLEAGIVSYSNQSKTRLLGVSEGALESFGAVSEEVVIAMVEGILEKTGADIALAVTGIAGPTGGSDEKPVGTVYIGWGSTGDIRTRLMQVKRERLIFQQLVSASALDLLRRYLLGLGSDGIYYFDELSRKRL